MRPAAIAKTLGVCRQTVSNILGDTFTCRPLDEAELAAREAS
jgi:DNA-binding XRE family transcriptional regulator